MNKQNIFTLIGIVLSFAIAIGGWVFISGLIDIRSDMLMSASGVSPILMPLQLPGTDDTVEEPIYTRPLLSEQEIVSILRNKNAPGREIPHEPTNEQINMEQAIIIGQSWLSFIGQQLYTHEELFNFSDVMARLSQKQQRGGDGLLSPEYSFWTVAFSGRYINATLLINATEGQVWKTEIFLTPVATPYTRDMYLYTITNPEWERASNVIYFETTIADMNNMLAEFVNIINVDAGEALERVEELVPIIVVPPRTAPSSAGVYTPTPQWRHWTLSSIAVIRPFADEYAYAAVRINGSSYDSDRWFINEISLYLGVR